MRHATFKEVQACVGDRVSDKCQPVGPMRELDKVPRPAWWGKEGFLKEVMPKAGLEEPAGAG